MKVLHLFSDWKWTGPAEPVVSLCESLSNRGFDVALAYRKTPIEFPERTVEKEVERRGVPGTGRFKLNRYFSPKDWFFDLKEIPRFIEENRVDIVHAHLSHDHWAAYLSLLRSNRKPLLVRTDHKRDGLPPDRAMRFLMQRTDGLVTYGERLRQQDLYNFDYPAERSVKLSPGVKPFTGVVTDARPSLGLKGHEKVIGVIGRLKKDRGYDVILGAFRRVRDQLENVKLVIVGRSSQVDESINKPLVALGLERDVILAGYRIEDYFSVIAAFDLFVMMRAGSDGTARALREVMGMGKPAIVSTKGMLPELVLDGKTGFVVDLDEYQLADRMVRLLTDDAARERMGSNARAHALADWDYSKQAERLIAFYENLVRLGKRK